MDAFEAISDRSRRRIIELVADRPRSAGDIAKEFTISRPAVSQHLGALLDCGILTVHTDGRRRIYRLDDTTLAQPHDWLDAQRRRWNRALDQLEQEMNND